MADRLVTKPLLNVLAGNREPIPPVWLMLQGGQYLPEYRKIREQAADFLDLCFDVRSREQSPLCRRQFATVGARGENPVG